MVAVKILDFDFFLGVYVLDFLLSSVVLEFFLIL